MRGDNTPLHFYYTALLALSFVTAKKQTRRTSSQQRYNPETSPENSF
jgi:hypothetical protein